MAELASVDATSENSLLTDFAKCTRLLVQWLDERPRLTTIEQIALENYLHVIHLSYGSWKRQQLMTEPFQVLLEREPMAEGQAE